MTTVGLVGLGLIGKERLSALKVLKDQGRSVEIVGAVDPVGGAATSQSAGVELMDSLEDLLATNPDWVIVATPHDAAVEIVATLLDSPCRVLVEKPMGRNLQEAERLFAAQRFANQLFVGMNYRFYEGIASLSSDVMNGAFGKPISCSIVLGHGGAPGDEKSWKLDPDAAGGGALIDPGIHLLDLIRQLAGGLKVVGARTWSGFWNTGIEEACHLQLEGERIPLVSVEVSIVRWRSTFRLEIWGDEGYGIVEGRNRSYGPQSYRRGQRWGWQGGSSQADSETQVLTSLGEDVFVRELDALLFGAASPMPPADARDAVETMRLLDDCRNAIARP